MKISIKKQIFGWSMYDFANTIFSALFITVYFPLFVVLKGGTAFHVGLVMSISMLLAGLLVPTLGGVADITRRKKLLLFMFTVLCCVFTFFTGFFGLLLVMVFGLLATFFFHASLDVYDALLVNISTKRNIGFVSGLGTAVGYLGTVLSVAIAYIIGLFYGFESISGIQIVFMAAALLFFGFSLFTFFFVEEASKIKIKKQHFVDAFKRVIFTIKNIKKFKSLWLFLFASFLYVDAANTATIFLFLFAKDQLGMGLIQFLPLYAIMAIAAVIGSLFFGKVTDKLGHKKTLAYVLILWIVVILILYFKTSYATFLLTGILGGALLGAIWTITRPMLVELAPKAKIAELFGYQGLTEKFSGVIGPVLFGFVAVNLGFKQSLLVVVALFLAGIIVLGFVKDKK
ncbi:MAG: MFS transporter [Candidatus Woesearchaeota archaeon]|jgi:UMF1 family MFS transporter|nr:MFS transporter [Candidatus Woesearchaeota archaeon]